MGNSGRYPVKMQELESPEDATAETLLQINGVLQLMPSCLRLYGHPDLRPSPLPSTDPISCHLQMPFGSKRPDSDLPPRGIKTV